MKSHLALIPALATLALATKPSFLNSGFNVTENKSCTLKFDQCANGCTITLQTGSETGKKSVKTLTTDAKGGTFTFTPSNIPPGSYNFMISDNDDNPEDVNYSSPFDYTGTGSALTTASASSTDSPSTSDAATTMSDSSSTESATSTASTTETSMTASSTSGTSSSAKASTTVPNAAAHATPFGIMAGALAAMAYLG